MEAVRVDLACRDRPYRDFRGAGEDGVEQLVAARRSQLLRVVEQRERPDAMVAQALVVQQHARDDERPGKGAPSRLVRACNEPRA
jgi:hypothetical protein